MNIHDVKCHPQYFKAVTAVNPNERKPFEVRVNDRNYRQGDIIRQHEYCPETGYTGWRSDFVITYVLDDPTYCAPGMVVMGIKPRWPDEAGAPRIVDRHVR